MLTCAVMGHAVGTGSALCVKYGVTPRGLYRHHITELQQQLLKEGARVIGMKADDPRDLAPKAEVTASSTGRHVETDCLMPPGNVINGYSRAMGKRFNTRTNAWAPGADAHGPHWIQLAWPEPVTFNVVHITFQLDELAPRGLAVEVQGAGEDRWRQIATVEDNWHRRLVLGVDRGQAERLRVVLAEPAGICEIRVYDEPPEVVAAAQRAFRTMRLPDCGPYFPWGDGPRRRPNLPGIVLDSEEATLRGHWQPSNWSKPFVGDGYLHDGNHLKGRKSIRFVPQLPSPGRYEIRLSYVPAPNRATNTPVTIETTDGPVIVRIDQRRKPSIDGMFHALGTFSLGNEPSITVGTEGTEGYVVVDAVQVLPAECTD